MVLIRENVCVLDSSKNLNKRLQIWFRTSCTQKRLWLRLKYDGLKTMLTFKMCGLEFWTKNWKIVFNQWEWNNLFNFTFFSTIWLVIVYIKCTLINNCVRTCVCESLSSLYFVSILMENYSFPFIFNLIKLNFYFLFFIFILFFIKKCSFWLLFT